jgi:heat shock protein HslJ
MDPNPNEVNPDDINFDDSTADNTDPNITSGDMNPGSTNSGDENSSKGKSNLAIMIVVVVGILLGAVLLFRSPSGDRASPTPGPGTPQIIQPMATPPTSTATQPVRPTQVQFTATAVQPTAVQPTVPPSQPNPIQGINWLWDSVTDNSAGQTTGVPVPDQYTINFNASGTVNGLADCNSFTGTYSQAGGLTIKITSMTRAACPEGSLDQQYIELLGNVASGGPDGSGNLALETAGGAQRMLFQNGGPAQ